MKKRIIKGVMAFCLCCIFVLTIGLCCSKKASALEENILNENNSIGYLENCLYEEIYNSSTINYTITSNNSTNLLTINTEELTFDENSLYCIDYHTIRFNNLRSVYIGLGYSYNNDNGPYIWDSRRMTNEDLYKHLLYYFAYPVPFSDIWQRINISGYRNSTDCSGAFECLIYKCTFSGVGSPIIDSVGNLVYENKIYYSNDNYIQYGADKYNEGLDSYYEGVEPMVLTNSTYYGGSSFVGINNDTPTRLYYSFDYGTDYLTFGGLNLSGGFDKYLLTVGFKDDYSITKVSFTPATSVTACIVNGNRYTEASYDGSYYYFEIPHIVSSDIVLELAPRADSTNLSKNVKIEGIADIPTLVYNAYNRGYNYGLELNQEKIETLEQQLNDGFTLFTPVSAFLNMTLAEFTLFDTTFKLTFGLLLSFILGLTAIFIVVKIFK